MLVWALLATVAAASLAVWSLRLVRRIDDLRTSAWEEPDTGALTRHGLEERARIELARAARSGTPVGLLALDVDGLRRINERWGYDEGDRIVHEVVAVVKEVVREADAIGHMGSDVGRLGGEEFVVLLPDCDPGAAFGVAERVVRGVSDRVRDRDGTAVTVSAGATGLLADGAGVDELIAIAVSAMRQAKQRGPARVVGAGPTGTPAGAAQR